MYKYEWHPEVDSCVRVLKDIPGICRVLSRNFIDPNALDDKDLTYQAPKVACDDKYGTCFLQSLPSCMIKAEYCKSKGLDVKVDEEGNVDCDLNQGQEIAENLLGTYFVRKFRSNAEGPIVGFFKDTIKNAFSWF
jgi:hypothetical protein